jgi:hypothetical protein
MPPVGKAWKQVIPLVNFVKLPHHGQGFEHKLEIVLDVSLTRFPICCSKSDTIWNEYTSKGNFSFTITKTKVQTVMDNTGPSAARVLSSKQLKFYPQEWIGITWMRDAACINSPRKKELSGRWRISECCNLPPWSIYTCSCNDPPCTSAHVFHSCYEFVGIVLLSFMSLFVNSELFICCVICRCYLLPYFALF